MEFIDLAAQQKLIRDKIENNIKKVLNHRKYIMGPEVKELEEKLADFTGVKYAIGCSSGTDALLMSLMVYNTGPGDYIITTPFTFIATAEVISLLGAKPIFVDIDEKTYNIDPVKIEGFLKTPFDPETKENIEYDRIKGINRIAKKYNLFVIEDAAQSFGAEYKGKKTGSLTDIGCTSFFPAKPLGCYGDGGMIFTDDEEIAQKLVFIRVHGRGKNKNDNIMIGINGRLDTIQAAILLVKFEVFSEEIDLRQEVAERYNSALKDKFYLQVVSEGYRSVWSQYSIRPREGIRNDYLDLLKNNNIPTAVYYSKMLHLQPAFSFLNYSKGDLPVCESCSENIFCLPFFPYITEDRQKYIIKKLLSI